MSFVDKYNSNIDIDEECDLIELKEMLEDRKKSFVFDLTEQQFAKVKLAMDYGAKYKLPFEIVCEAMEYAKEAAETTGIPEKEIIEYLLVWIRRRHAYFEDYTKEELKSMMDFKQLYLEMKYNIERNQTMLLKAVFDRNNDDLERIKKMDDEYFQVYIKKLLVDLPNDDYLYELCSYRFYLELKEAVEKSKNNSSIENLDIIALNLGEQYFENHLHLVDIINWAYDDERNFLSFGKTEKADDIEAFLDSREYERDELGEYRENQDEDDYYFDDDFEYNKYNY